MAVNDDLLNSMATTAPEAVSADNHTVAPTQTERYDANFQKTWAKNPGFLPPTLPHFNNKYEEREYLKGKLAGAFRIFGHYNLNEGIAGAIAARDPVDPNTFWINPFGVEYNIINKSDLIRVDHDGNILEHGRVKARNTGPFLILGAVMRARPEILCVAHSHNIYGRAMCVLGKGIDAVSMESSFFYEDHIVFDGKGVVMAADEAVDIAEKLGGCKAALLGGHGPLTCGQTIEECVYWYYQFDRCAQAQLLADAAVVGAGRETVKLTQEEARYNRSIAGNAKGGWFGGNMMFEYIDKLTGKEYMQ